MELKAAMKGLFWNTAVKVFGFWNVYYFPKNLPCFFLGHKWSIRESFRIKPGNYAFGLDTCSRCGFHKWTD